MTPIPTAQRGAPASTETAANHINPKVKPKKRAVDFLSDDEENDGGAPVTKPTDAEITHTEKPKKKNPKKDKAAVNGEAAETTIDSEAALKATVDPVKAFNDVSAAPKRKKAKAEPISQEPATRSDKPATLFAPKKKGPSTIDVHAEKIKKLLGQKDTLLKQNKKAKKAGGVQAAGLGANGVSGVSSNAVDESLNIAAKEATSTSMQAEAQRTTEKELEEEYGSDEEIDQAGALLEGFDSDTEDLAQDEGFDKDKPIGALPNYKKTQKKLRQAAQKGNKDGPGVVYVGRIPHGFYENEMRQYFSQFGTISKLRLSRNKKTGHSKHFAFLEFESNEVAKIVAETMDSYLMFGHILRCKYVQPESLHPDVFKGANKRFRVAPHNRMEKRALEAPKSESQWKEKNSKEQSRREKKAEKLQAMGYDIELPKLKSPSEVLQQKESQAASEEKAPHSTEVDGKDVPAPTAVPKDEVTLSKKKSKKDKKEKTVSTERKGATIPAAGSTAHGSVLTQTQNNNEGKSEKRDKRKEKREKVNADDKAKLVTAQLVMDEGSPTANDQPAETVVESTTTTDDSSKASRSLKNKKKKNKVNGGTETAQIATDQTPAPATANPEIASVEKDALPSIMRTEIVEGATSKKKSKKRKSSTAGDELAEPKSNSTERAARVQKEKKVTGEAGTKSGLKKAKKC